ncbi:hypothetical protein SYNPS1DRAFT_9804, partial [Syncephalis pseudoplumigaleata]
SVMPALERLASQQDVYTPRRIEGVGRAKQGQCPICYDEAKPAWFCLKTSAYWYHMNFFHGISSVTRRPYANPLYDGLCHQCRKWIPMDSVRHTAVKVPMIYWWKHAQQCHA